MVYPLANNTDEFHPFTYYQAVITGQLICTLATFVFLQAFHYAAWGHEEQAWQLKKDEEGPSAVQPLPASDWKWDQKGWNMYFAIIFGNHICAIFLPMAYCPDIFVSVLAYVHLAFYLTMLINTACVNQKQPGEGGRTVTNRICWGCMCVVNLILIIAGLRGISDVIR